MLWDLAEKFGWTLDYIESLPVEKMWEYTAVKDGIAKAQATLSRRKKL